MMFRVHGDFTGRMATRNENNQGKKPSVCFSNPANNALIYCSYLMTTNVDSMEEEAKGGDDSQNNNFILPSHFEILE